MTINGVTVEPVEYDSAAHPEQNPPALPRRSAQQHLEPQLREERGAGNGTPFAPFTPGADRPESSHDDATPDSEPATDDPAGAAGTAAARDGARGTRGRHAAEPDDD